MNRRFGADIPSHRITPPEVFFNRREFVALLGLGGAAMMALPADAGGAAAVPEGLLKVPLKAPKGLFPAKRNAAYVLPPNAGTKLTPREVAASHNNFYEFLEGRGGPAWQFADAYVVDPWKVEVTGLCNKPQTFDLDALFKFEHEERLYHFRCVERWAMNVPWSGFPLKKLLDRVEPKAEAKFVAFTTVNRPDQMPGLKKSPWYPWPYREALRMDEATNELAFVATGIYGEPLLKQHGAPVRIVVPWKYGYKNPKAIVKIELVSKQPKTFWMVQPHEYGFLSNINPNIPHPRWSQAQSYWLDTQERFPTAIWNGYEKYVAALYPDEPRAPQKPLNPGQVAR